MLQREARQQPQAHPTCNINLARSRGTCRVKVQCIGPCAGCFIDGWRAVLGPADVHAAVVELDLMPLEIADLRGSQSMTLGDQDHGRVSTSVAAVLAGIVNCGLAVLCPMSPDDASAARLLLADAAPPLGLDHRNHIAEVTRPVAIARCAFSACAPSARPQCPPHP
jgi:hypothetical protein